MRFEIMNFETIKMLMYVFQIGSLGPSDSKQYQTSSNCTGGIQGHYKAVCFDLTEKYNYSKTKDK